MSGILDWFTPTRWIILGVVVLAMLASFIGYGELRARQATEAVTNRYEAAIGKMKVEAATTLAGETRKVLDLERQLGALRAAQEKTDAENTQTVAGLERKLRAAGGPTLRLRDPNQARCGGGDSGAASAVAAGADSGAANHPEAGGLFSAGATELLERLTREADDINVAYASCRSDAMNIRALTAPVGTQ